MAVDLHTGDTSLPYHRFLHDKRRKHNILLPSHDLNHSNSNINGSALKPQVLIPRKFGIGSHKAHSTQPPRKDNDNHMAHFMLQHSSIGSHHLESSWESFGSSQSTLSSPLGSNKEPLPDSHDSCWENTYDVVGMLEKMKLEEKGRSKYHPGYGVPLLQEQIQAIQLPRFRQEQIPFQKLTAYGERNKGQIFQKNGKGVDVGCDNRRRSRPPWHVPQHQTGSEMRAIFLDTSGSRGTSCGTGVFLPRGGTSASSESRRRPGKGCSTVLIPARVVQALQLHFDQMSATSGPKVGGFPPLHDVLVSNRDGMYSLQKRQSRKTQTHIQNEMILPQEWTY